VTRTTLLTLGLAFWLVPAATAQEITASLSGTVTDTSGAVVPNAAIRATHANTGVVAYQGVTNSSGVYSAPSLPVGPYRLTAEAPGFKKAEITGIHLQVDQRARINITLSPGEVAETITVVGEGLGQIEAESSSVGAVINTSQVKDLPMPPPNV
jgi:hypothetical protein